MDKVDHETIHTGGARYSCLFCSKKFRYNPTLYSHMKKYHKEDYANYNAKKAEQIQKEIDKDTETPFTKTIKIS